MIPSSPEMERFAREALWSAEQSPCWQSKRGAVVFDPESLKILSYGWNRPPRPFTCEKYCKGKVSCSIDVVHAEMVALLRLKEQQIARLVPKCRYPVLLRVKAKNGKPLPSGMPSCVGCSKHLLDAGFSGVLLLHADGWKFYSMIDFHNRSRENDKLLKS